MDLWSNNLHRKVIVVLISITLMLVLFAPVCAVWTPEYEWTNVYIYESELELIALIPFFLLYPLMLYIKNKVFKIITKAVLLIFATIYFLFSLLSNSVPAQDYSPELGSLLLLTILPQLLYLFYIDYQIKNKPVNNLLNHENQ